MTGDGLGVTARDGPGEGCGRADCLHVRQGRPHQWHERAGRQAGRLGEAGRLAEQRDQMVRGDGGSGVIGGAEGRVDAERSHTQRDREALDARRALDRTPRAGQPGDPHLG